MDAMRYLGYVQMAREGTRRIRESMESYRLPEPQFRQEALHGVHLTHMGDLQERPRATCAKGRARVLSPSYTRDAKAHYVLRKKADDEPNRQLDRFKEAARQLETDDDPERFKERLKKLVRHKPVEKPK